MKKIQDFFKDSDLSLPEGQMIVLYFYPKDNTSGCTMEAVEFNDLLPEFEKLGTKVIGISRDSEKKHANFKEKYNLNLELLSDPKEKIHHAFDVMKMKKLYGKEYLGVDRSTFVFDEKGILIKEYRNVKPSGHAAQVLKDLKERAL